MTYQRMLSPADCGLALIDFLPAMFQGVQSHDRKMIVDNAQVLAGLWTGACVNFPALDMLSTGYKVFVVADACCDTSP